MMNYDILMCVTSWADKIVTAFEPKKIYRAPFIFEIFAKLIFLAHFHTTKWRLRSELSLPPYPRIHTLILFGFATKNFSKKTSNRVKNKLLPRIRTFREITFFMLCVTKIFKSNFECLRLVTMNWERDLVQLNMPPETKIDCETKKHLSLSEE
jgi:hypothetical protein